MSARNCHINDDCNDCIDISFGNERFSSIKLYEDEWKDLYCKQEIDIELLKQKSIEGKLKTSYFRSICWRCLLGILHKQPNQWLCQLQTYRKHYNEVCLELQHNPRISCNDITFDNPLSQESDSEWQKYFCDEDLKSVIFQDVKRTFPDIDYFRSEIIQNIMVRILFCYARQNPTLSYRQGMHEILAPLIFILHCDHQAFLYAKEQKLGIDETLSEILNPDYLEQDAFSLFKNIMNHIQCSYRINNNSVVTTNTFSEKNLKEESKTYQNEVLVRLDFIKKNLLHQIDPELNDYLEKLDIPMHLFGIRWLRLLFGREFSLQDLLILWDFIFASNFETVNYIVVAMLVAIRQILLNSNYTACLTSLMRYPNEVNVNYIKEFALHLKDPKKHTVLETPPLLKNDFQQVENLPSTPNFRLKKSTSKSKNWLPGKPNVFQIGQIGDGDNVTQGFMDDNIGLLKGELDYMKTLIGITYRKLDKFHSILFLNLPKNSNPDIQLVIDGIHELSCLLQNHYKRNNCEIETACEAGEMKNLDEKNSKLEKMINKKNFKPPTPDNAEMRSHTLPKARRGLKSGELKVFKHEIGGPISKMPMIDPLYLIKKMNDSD